MREVVPRALDGQRLDRVVALVTGCSRAEAAALVDEGAVAVGGRPVTSRSHRVSDGDVVEVEVPERPGDGAQRKEKRRGPSRDGAVVIPVGQAQIPWKLDGVSVTSSGLATVAT